MKIIINYDKPKVKKTLAQRKTDAIYKKNLIQGIKDLSFGTMKEDNLKSKTIPELEKIFDNCHN